MAKSPLPTVTAQAFQNEPFTHQISPSSSTDGFFQTPPKLENSFYEDAAYRRIFSCQSTLFFKGTETG